MTPENVVNPDRQRTDTYQVGICYFRNLVARCYREIRYLGTTGIYAPLQQYYEACKRRLDFGRTWVNPVFQQIKRLEDLSLIEQTFADRVDGLTLIQIREAFEKGSWRAKTGGPKWLKIARATEKLGDTLRSGQDEAVLDSIHTVNGLWHNTRRVVEDFIEPCK